MTKRPAKPAHMSWVIPYLMVEDAGKAADYYRDVLGLEILSTAQGEQDQTFHAELRYKDIVIMCGNAAFWGEQAKTPTQGHYLSPVNLYLYCEDVDAEFARIKKAGGMILTEPQDEFWGDRTFRVTDFDGHQWTFGTNIADHD